MRTILILTAVVGAGTAGAFWYMDRASTEDTAQPTTNVTYDTVRSGEPLGGGVRGGTFAPDATIARVADGYEPKEVTIQQGGTVMFTNESASFHWPASDVHPTHTIYSEFDPLEPIAPGDTWSFTFMEPGTWAFHDHIRANFKGTVTVVPAQ